ncbi:hypothetical protein [Campylobacter helveticus]|uniref:Uncharacterized protein n=3 Tax=Campylobacter helveticus TaxID=28898 RepID=A0ABY3KZZ4_9BACT|nr:hypothetical protein [Campylobacter helveticus]MCR2040305.1 hypothetical protein [Campylobacter helveticus]TXK56151.1 hypothetical protein FVD16_08470 [Campylobacter helveticus]
MQVTNTNSKEAYKLSYESSIKEQEGFAEILEQEQKKQIEFEDIDNMEELSEFMWNKRLNATTKEEARKYEYMMLHIWTVKFGVAMGEAMKKQGITCPQDMDIELFKQARQEVSFNEEHFKDYLLSGIRLLETPGCIVQGQGGTRPETPAEFKTNLNATANLLKAVLKEAD